jgi:hypothetical protein
LKRLPRDFFCTTVRTPHDGQLHCHPNDLARDCPRDIMPEKAIICWVVGQNHSITTNDELYINLTEDEIAARLKQNRYERTKLENSSWLICRRKSLNTTREYLDEKEFLSNSSKRRSFEALFMKYFDGDEREIKILRALHTDIFILLCLTFNRTLFKAITEKGLQDVFAKLINGAFKEPWTIPQWVVHRAKDSMINFKSEEAEQLRQGITLRMPTLASYIF